MQNVATVATVTKIYHDSWVLSQRNHESSWFHFRF